MPTDNHLGYHAILLGAKTFMFIVKSLLLKYTTKPKCVGGLTSTTVMHQGEDDGNILFNSNFE